MDKLIKYGLGAVAIVVGLCAFNAVFDQGQIAWAGNIGIALVIVTAWVLVDRYTERKDAQTARNAKKRKGSGKKRK